MADKSKIAWTDSTFNPFIGCTKVSPGCTNCYAATMSNHYKWAEWGPRGIRKKTSEKYWKKPLSWDNNGYFECADCGWRGEPKDVIWSPIALCPECESKALITTRHRVFCASLADVYEDNDQLVEWRNELLDLIVATPNLDWLVLTKRPENVAAFSHFVIPENMWIGTSVENQEYADKRIPELLKVDARIKFLSVEPQLGEVDIRKYLGKKLVNWVIVGGESGSDCRPFDPDWARLIRDQCEDARIPFFMKQLGGHPYKHDQLNDLPFDLRIREYPR